MCEGDCVVCMWEGVWKSGMRIVESGGVVCEGIGCMGSARCGVQ